MKYGITLYGNRVAPRCSSANSLLMVTQRRNGINSKKKLEIPNLNLPDLCDLLLQHHIDILVCGGITREHKDFLRTRNLDIIDNVACSTDRIIQAVKAGNLRQGFGFIDRNNVIHGKVSNHYSVNGDTNLSQITENHIEQEKHNPDCLSCTDKICLDGKVCEEVFHDIGRQSEPNTEMLHMLEAATDIACEKERTLCRLSELIYFCLEMQYAKLGVAYCVDLEEPTEILVKVLRRFFTVYPVCCKVGGNTQINPLQTETQQNQRKTFKDIACNPWGQAQVLNQLGTNLNVMVGLCMGADCVFMQGSQAPATGLFIKDKSLANNPIGAIYSEYYLKEATRAHP